MRKGAGMLFGNGRVALGLRRRPQGAVPPGGHLLPRGAGLTKYPPPFRPSRLNIWQGRRETPGLEPSARVTFHWNWQVSVLTASRVVVLNRGDLVPPGDIWQCLMTVVRDTAKHSKIHRASPAIKNYLAQVSVMLKLRN